MSLRLESPPEQVWFASSHRREVWSTIHITLAAAAMVATLPGRTHGLGLITEPLLSDLQLDRVTYAYLNSWATVLGAACCVPFGWLLDRLGVRLVLTATLLLLGSTVVGMSGISERWNLYSPLSLLGDLFVLILLTRALGQSALSVVSLALMGKSTGRHSGLLVGIYSFLTALGFMGAFALVKRALEAWQADWRTMWAGIGLAVLVLAPFAAVLVRPEGFQQETTTSDEASVTTSHTLTQALATPAFWIFALATSLYALITSGISLFNQSILEERGFDRAIFLTITLLSPLVGLASNLVTGWLAGRWSMSRMLSLAMLGLTAALCFFPYVTTVPEVYGYAVAMGAVGGMVTVLFFGVWSRAFGPRHLGRIQGAAQMLTVLASAAGPLLLAQTQRATGSYLPLFRGFALVAGLLGLSAWFIPWPTRCSAGDVRS